VPEVGDRIEAGGSLLEVAAVDDTRIERFVLRAAHDDA
jgi:CBS domain containing-hemolysin-like protein